MIMGAIDMTQGDLPYLKVYCDNNGHWRYYFRRAGKTKSLPGNRKKKDFSDAKFLAAYTACIEETGGVPVNVERKRGSLWHACQDYYRSAMFRNLAPTTQKEYRRTLAEICKKHGQRPFVNMRRKHIEAIRDSKLVMDGDQIVSGHGAAKNYVNALRGLCKWAYKAKRIDPNPTRGVELYKTKRSYERWPDEAVEAFLEVADDNAALALHLLLYTGQRRGDVAAMTWKDYDGSGIQVVQQKTGVKVWIPCHPNLKNVLNSAERSGVTILTSSTGRAFTSKHLGHWLSEFMDKADLRKEHGLTVHGLRATAASKLAEAGCTDFEVMAITGHSTLKMVQHYTKGARQKVRAISAIGKLGK